MEVSLVLKISDATVATEIRAAFKRAARSSVSFFDGEVCGMAGQMYKHELATVKRTLEAEAIEDFALDLDNHALFHRFVAMQFGARCGECESDAIRYLPDSFTGVGSDQIVCDGCGGMFNAAQFFPGRIAHFRNLEAKKWEKEICFDPLLGSHKSLGSDSGLTGFDGVSNRARCLVSHKEGAFTISDLRRPKRITTRVNGEYVTGDRELVDGDTIELLPKLTAIVSIRRRD